MWFPANKPKPGSPLVYVFVDPTCPHCAWSFEHLKQRIDDNTIDLRVIMALILSPEAADRGFNHASEGYCYELA